MYTEIAGIETKGKLPKWRTGFEQPYFPHNISHFHRSWTVFAHFRTKCNIFDFSTSSCPPPADSSKIQMNHCARQMPMQSFWLHWHESTPTIHQCKHVQPAGHFMAYTLDQPRLRISSIGYPTSILISNSRTKPCLTGQRHISLWDSTNGNELQVPAIVG